MLESTIPDGSTAPHFEEVVRERLSRRGAIGMLAVLGGGAVGAVLTSGKVSAEESEAPGYAPGELTFDPLPLNNNDQISLSPGFKHDVVISWGDPVVPGAPAFDIGAQTPTKQAQQFGFNNDYVDFRPLPYGSSRSRRGQRCDVRRARRP